MCQWFKREKIHWDSNKNTDNDALSDITSVYVLQRRFVHRIDEKPETRELIH